MPRRKSRIMSVSIPVSVQASSMFNLYLASSYRDPSRKLSDTTVIATGENPPQKTLQQAQAHYQYITERPPSKPEQYFSTTPFYKLKLITIPEMRINIRAKGSYLLLRTIERALYKNTITTVVEDSNGNISLFEAAYMVSQRYDRDANAFMPPGTCIIVKEPLLKSDIYFHFYVSCDSPSDIIILNTYHKLFYLAEKVNWRYGEPLFNPFSSCSVQVLNNMSTKFMEEKNWRQALYCMETVYSRKSYLSLEELLHCECELAGIYLFLGFLELSFQHAKNAMTIYPISLGGPLLAGRVLLLLKQYGEALKYFELCKSKNTHMRELSEDIKRCHECLQEMQGQISIYNFYLHSVSYPHSELDLADFVGPLKVVFHGGARRVVATQDIEPGTMLVAARSMVYAEERVPMDADRHHAMFERSFTHDFDLYCLTQETCQMSYRCPETFGRVVYNFIDDTDSFNSGKTQLYCDESGEVIVDVKKIQEAILKYTFPVQSHKNMFGILPGKSVAYGLFNFPSYFNHKCTANATWMTLKNLIFIHSNTSIKSGDEVTISYIEPTTNALVKERYFAERGITCNCELCEEDRKEENIYKEKREKIMHKAESLYFKELRDLKSKLVIDHTKEWSQLVEDMQKTYMKSGRRQLQLYQVFLISSLANAYSASEPMATIMLLWKALWFAGIDCETLGDWSRGKEFFRLPSPGFYSSGFAYPILKLVTMYHKVGLVQEARTCLKAFITLESVLFGVNQKMVEGKYKCIPEGIMY